MKYAGDAVTTYARMDKLLVKFKIAVDETMSPYKRPTAKVGVEITFHINEEHDINMVEGVYPPSLLCSAETPCHDSVRSYVPLCDCVRMFTLYMNNISTHKNSLLC